MVDFSKLVGNIGSDLRVAVAATATETAVRAMSDRLQNKAAERREQSPFNQSQQAPGMRFPTAPAAATGGPASTPVSGKPRSTVLQH